MRIGKEAQALLLAACLLLAAPFGQSPSTSPDALNQKFEAAVSDYRNGRYAQAQEILTSLLSTSPNNFELNELMGLIDQAERRTREAETRFAKAVGEKPDSAEARVYWASTLAALRQYSHAEREFLAAVRLEPTQYDPNHDLGEFYLATGKLSSAIPYLQKAQLANPSSIANGHDLVLAEIKTGRFREAKADLGRLLALHRSQPSADLVSLLAAVDEKMGRLVAAAQEYQLAAHLSPTEENVFAWGGDMLLHHAYAPAERIFSQGAKMYPRSLRMEIGWGIAAYSLNHYPPAVTAFANAIQLSPNDRRPYEMLYMVYGISPREAPVVTGRFAHAASVEPDNPYALYYYALCLIENTRAKPDPAISQRAESLLERVVDLDPSLADAHLQLGILYSRQSETAKAIAQYQQALAKDPSLAQAHYRLATALVQAGKRGEAQREFQTFSRLQSLQSKEHRTKRAAIMDLQAILASPAK